MPKPKLFETRDKLPDHAMTKLVAFRATSSEHKLIRQMARKAGQNISDFIRQLVQEYHRENKT